MTIHTDEPEFVPLTEVAKVLGVHRATVNDMVRQRKILGRRRHGRWYVHREELKQFAARYKRPSNAPMPRDERLISESGWQILSFLVEWDDATSAELNRVVKLHIGNIRKQLNLLGAADLAEREGGYQRGKEGVWRPTVEGRKADLVRRSASTALDIAS